jgi:microtubule-associated protein-like 6
MWCVVDAESMEVVTKGQEAKEWISDLKYSPDGKQLAIGSHDSKIYLYDATKGYAYKGIKCEAHNSYITHFDYTSDGKCLRSTCGAYELLFHSASNVAQDPSGASKLTNTEFTSETCTLGWGVQGI